MPRKAPRDATSYGSLQPGEIPIYSRLVWHSPLRDEIAGTHPPLATATSAGAKNLPREKATDTSASLAETKTAGSSRPHNKERS